MKEFIEKNYGLTFAALIQDQLETPTKIGTGSRSWREALNSPTIYYRVEGKLSLLTHGEVGETTAPVRIMVHPNWMNVRPIVFCGSSFIRYEIDWHIYGDGSLCYVFPEEWRWQLKRWWDQGVTVEQLMKNAAIWCRRNVDSLITRHLYGRRLGVENWLTEWACWSHGERGEREFQNYLKGISKSAA